MSVRIFFLAKSTILLIIAFQLAGCATQNFRSNATPEQRKSIAIVYRQGGAVSSFVSSMIMPIGMKKNINIVTVDGEKIVANKSSNRREYWLKPGEHEIEIKCTVQFDSSFYDGKASVRKNLLAGREYVLDAVIPNKNQNICNPIILTKNPKAD
ncbi:MAG TPA: hypothetical protein ENJ41_00190 [Oceanospirillales bacterium]|nr:hypothetical protein [Oceanospirillales bacterium]